jgi:hypothetical protein
MSHRTNFCTFFTLHSNMRSIARWESEIRFMPSHFLTSSTFCLVIFRMLPETLGYLYVGGMDMPFSTMKVSPSVWKFCRTANSLVYYLLFAFNHDIAGV